MLSPVLFCARRRGHSVTTILFLIALVLGGALFAWNKFIRVRPLVMAGKQVVVMRDYNQTADLEYRRHFKEHNQGNCERCRLDVRQFVSETVQGKYANKNDQFDERYQELINELLADISELDMNAVPPAFLSAHTKLSASFRPFYESLEALQQGYCVQGEEQKARYEEARHKVAEGNLLSQQGEEGILGLIQR